MLLRNQSQKTSIWSHWIFVNDTSKSKMSSLVHRISNCPVALLQYLNSSLSLIALPFFSSFFFFFGCESHYFIWTVAFFSSVCSSQSLAGQHAENRTDAQCPSISSTGNQDNSFFGAVQWNICPYRECILKTVC